MPRSVVGRRHRGTGRNRRIKRNNVRRLVVPSSPAFRAVSSAHRVVLATTTCHVRKVLQGPTHVSRRHSMETSRKKLSTGIFTNISSNNQLIGSSRVFTGTANGTVRVRSDRASVRRESWRTRSAPSYIRIWVAAFVLVL